MGGWDVPLLHLPPLARAASLIPSLSGFTPGEDYIGLHWAFVSEDKGIGSQGVHKHTWCAGQSYFRQRDGLHLS